MPAVLVHGVPDTFHVWDGVRAHLNRPDVEALALPGFGAPRPDDFSATKEAYVDWIIHELEQQDEPVDLVGHDWGCMLTARVASLRPDLVRTWAGGSGPLSSGYVWHPWAQIWQTPGAGEQWMADLDPVAFAGDLKAYGVPPEVADATADRLDPVVRDSILRLYRSAAHVGAEWEADLAKVTSPALVFWGIEDPAVPFSFAAELAQAMNGTVLGLQSQHWTILEKPAEVAAALHRHWRAEGRADTEAA